MSFGWLSKADENSDVWQAIAWSVDQQATGDQHLKLLESCVVVLLWTGLADSLHWHLAIKNPE